MKAHPLFRLAVVAAALAFASQARAQGDMDFLTETVPPNVMIQFDTSGSMRAVILPEQYKTARGTAGPSQTWFTASNNSATWPASYVDTQWCKPGDSGTNCSGITENYERTCQIYSGSSAWTGGVRLNGDTDTSDTVSNLNETVLGMDLNQDGDATDTDVDNVAEASFPKCQPGSTADRSCYNDTDDNLQQWSGWSTTYSMRCWNIPGGCASVPAGFSCTVQNNRTRRRAPSNGTGNYYTITQADWSTSSTTLFPQNYLWWIVQEIYKGATPVPVIPQDRLAAAKDAVAQLVDATNQDGYPAKVKFGLARYDSGSNGGYVVVPAALDNKTTLLSTLNDPNLMPASGGTPLSETLVDVARYFGGADTLGSYSAYNRNLTGGTGGTVPPSPIENACEKNFVIVVTDGEPSSDCNDHHGTAFTSTIGNYDGLNSPADVPTGECPSGGGKTNWLDDIAKYVHDNDLRGDLIGLQNVYVYTVGFNVNAPLLQAAATAGGGSYYVTSNATDLAQSLINAVQEILQRNTSFSSATVPSTRTAFGDGFYTAYFMPGGTKGTWRGHLEAYRLSPSLDVLDRFGNIALDPITDTFVEPRQPFWDAADTVLADYATRPIYVTRAGARAAFVATDPNNAAQLGVTIAEEPLYPHYVTDPNLINTDEQLGDAIVNYVHGADAFDEDADTDVTEPREWIFGDVFHSNPVAVGPAMPFLRNETGYGPASDANSFMGRFGLRQRVLYVGANDGMVHALDAGSFQDPDPNTPGDEYYSAGDGSELFGYIPGFLLNKVKRLPQLNTGKQFFMDGSGSAADVFIDYDGDGIREGTDWTTALIMPARQGGEGVLALDVTDPTGLTANHAPYPRLMWEFTHAGLGESWSRPIITRVKLRASTGTGDRCGVNDGDGDCKEEWVAIFGAGYRVEGDPNLGQYTNDPNNPTYTEKGRGVFIVRMSNGTVLARLRQIQGNAIFGKMRYAIPAEPAVIDSNFDGFADVIYVGDLGGQLWKWDLSTVGVESGGVVSTTNWPADVFFAAPVATIAGGASHYHSIFQSAAAAYMNNVLTLSFASGERTDMGYIGEADPSDPNSLVGLYDDNNRFWVLKDATPTGSGAFPSDLPIMEAGASGATGHPTLTDITDIPVDNNPADAGYFFRVQDGEKFISNHLIFGGEALTLSYLPSEISEEIEPAEGEEVDVCTISGQTNQWKWNLETGGGALQDPDDSTSNVRSLVLGNGAPTDPRLTISKDNNGNMVIKITAQTSTGAIANPDPPANALDLVDLIYWRQNF
jgi:Tfp pilus tip-associated adhesin PilY1